MYWNLAASLSFWVWMWPSHCSWRRDLEKRKKKKLLISIWWDFKNFTGLNWSCKTAGRMHNDPANVQKTLSRRPSVLFSSPQVPLNAVRLRQTAEQLRQSVILRGAFNWSETFISYSIAHMLWIKTVHRQTLRETDRQTGRTQLWVGF